MKKMILTSLLVVATMSAGFANASAKLKIPKASTDVVEIKDGANTAEEESSAVADSMRHIYVESEEAESKEVLEYVETEMGHQEAASSVSNSEEKAEKAN